MRIIIHTGLMSNRTESGSTLAPYHYIVKEEYGTRVYKLSTDKKKLVYVGDIIEESDKYPRWYESQLYFDSIDEYVEYMSRFNAWESGWGCPHKLKKIQKTG